MATRPDRQAAPGLIIPGDRTTYAENAAARRAPGITITDGPVNQAVADRLWDLHWHYGYFTRAEIADALGLDAA
jgi:hypothetical protein